MKSILFQLPPLEEKSSQKQEAQHKDHCVNDDFDKTHKISYPFITNNDSIADLPLMSKTFDAISPIFEAIELILQIFTNIMTRKCRVSLIFFMFIVSVALRTL